jgi:hypothetical protein
MISEQNLIQKNTAKELQAETNLETHSKNFSQANESQSVDLISYLLNNPLEIKDFTPFTRDEVNER